MSKAQFKAARQLIRDGHTDQARELLKTINHPQAQQWLNKLDERDPPKRRNPFAIIILSLIGLSLIGAAIILIRARTPTANNPAPDSRIAQVPTLAELPAIVASVTPIPITVVLPSPTATITLTSTVTPSATITDTPPPTYTSRPTSTRFPTSTPVPQCDFLTWDTQALDIWGNATLSSGAIEYEIAAQQVAALPYPSCVVAAREYFINYLLEVAASWRALDAMQFEESNSRIEIANMHLSNYQIEIDRLFNEFANSLPLPDIRYDDSPSSFACPSSCAEARSRGISAGMAAACGLDGDGDGVACYGD